MRILEGRTLDDYNKMTIIYPIFWNFIPAIIFIIIACIYLLVKKKIMLSFILSYFILNSLVIFLTAPSSLFMYYFSEYLIGNVVFVFGILYIVKKKKEKNCNNC